MAPRPGEDADVFRIYRHGPRSNSPGGGDPMRASSDRRHGERLAAYRPTGGRLDLGAPPEHARVSRGRIAFCGARGSPASSGEYQTGLRLLHRGRDRRTDEALSSAGVRPGRPVDGSLPHAYRTAASPRAQEAGDAPASPTFPPWLGALGEETPRLGRRGTRNRGGRTAPSRSGSSFQRGASLETLPRALCGGRYPTLGEMLGIRQRGTLRPGSLQLSQVRF